MDYCNFYKFSKTIILYNLFIKKATFLNVEEKYIIFETGIVVMGSLKFENF